MASNERFRLFAHERPQSNSMAWSIELRGNNITIATSLAHLFPPRLTRMKAIVEEDNIAAAAWRSAAVDTQSKLHGKALPKAYHAATDVTPALLFTTTTLDKYLFSTTEPRCSYGRHLITSPPGSFLGMGDALSTILSGPRIRHRIPPWGNHLLARVLTPTVACGN